MGFWQRIETVNLWRLDFGQPPRRRRLAPTNRRQSSPQYSPDGRKLVFMSNRSGETEIWTAGADGGNLMPLTAMGTLGTFAGTPRWSPDGLEIAFDARPRNNPDIYSSMRKEATRGGLRSHRPRTCFRAFRTTDTPSTSALTVADDLKYGRLAARGPAAQVTREGGVAGLRVSRWQIHFLYELPARQ